MEYINPHGSRHHWERGRYEGSWKGMKKHLEQDMLCEKLRGRVSYHFEVYPKLSVGSGCFHVILDGLTIKKFGYYYSGAKLGWKLTFPDEIPIAERDEYASREFAEALEAYRNQPIADSIASKNPIQRMFAIVDRRVGKRTLDKLKDSVLSQPEWLRILYHARLEAEGIRD